MGVATGEQSYEWVGAHRSGSNAERVEHVEGTVWELQPLCWLVTDGICSKRLAPFLPELLDRLRLRQALREFPVAVQARVAQLSAATV